MHLDESQDKQSYSFEELEDDLRNRFDLVPAWTLEEPKVNTNKVKMNERKLSKVKSVQGNGTWENNGTTFYKFEYLMDDGQIVNAIHKGQEPRFKIGEEAAYEITNQQYNNGKLHKPEHSIEQRQSGDPKKHNSIVAQACVKAACDAYSGLNKPAKEITDLAEALYAWVNTK